MCSSKLDGPGSIRLGTPVTEARASNQSSSQYSGLMQPSRSSSAPDIKAAPTAVRSGFMPAEDGKLQRSRQARSPDAVQGLSPEFAATIAECFGRMDRNGDGSITRAEASSFFLRFGGISADAMFRAVDEDNDDTISLDEFLAFWASVKRNGYSEADLIEELSDLLEGNAWVAFERSNGKSYGSGA